MVKTFLQKQVNIHKVLLSVKQVTSTCCITGAVFGKMLWHFWKNVMVGCKNVMVGRFSSVFLFY